MCQRGRSGPARRRSRLTQLLHTPCTLASTRARPPPHSALPACVAAAWGCNRGLAGPGKTARHGTARTPGQRGRYALRRGSWAWCRRPFALSTYTHRSRSEHLHASPPLSAPPRITPRSEHLHASPGPSRAGDPAAMVEAFATRGEGPHAAHPANTKRPARPRSRRDRRAPSGAGGRPGAAAGGRRGDPLASSGRQDYGEGRPWLSASARGQVADLGRGPGTRRTAAGMGAVRTRQSRAPPSRHADRRRA
jgi:hypothetical protein